MKINAIKREIPAEISELGGALVTLVDKETVELETSIAESLDGLYVIGDRLLIKGFFVGLFKSMIAGISRDGHARQLGDFLTMYPVALGEFDVEKGWQEGVNEIKIRVRLMNELTIDISDWEFVDVTPGRKPFKIESVKAGDTVGVVVTGQATELNGSGLPLTDEISVDWALEGTALSGTVPSAKVTSSITRANIAADAFSSLRQEGNEGKTLTLTVRGNCASAKKSAILAFPLPLEMKLSDVYATAFGTNVSISFTAENLKGSLGYAKTATGSTAVAYIKVGSAAEVAKTLAFDTEDPTSYMNNLEIACNPGDTVTITFKPDPAKAADYKQTPATATVIAQG